MRLDNRGIARIRGGMFAALAEMEPLALYVQVTNWSGFSVAVLTEAGSTFVASISCAAV